MFSKQQKILINKEIDKFIALAGGTLVKAANRIDCTHSAILHWKTRCVPVGRVYQLYSMWPRKLKKENFRPDVFGGKK